MSFRLPTIAYDIDGIHELVNHKINGYLVEKFNTKEMADSIISLLSDDELSYRLGLNGYNTIKNKFTFISMLNEHRKFLKKIELQKYS